ncbi:MAG: tetratricopeptide repeat protein [Spirochaetaceae bacterium]|jgi:tetratricopeptide (TPR) repeat protein|nr:tetratricopeptide repeat protein [Spirochaetaceae bacterium]
MAANTGNNEKDGGISDKLVGFIQRNRRVLWMVTLGIVILLIAFIAGLSIRDSLRLKAITAVEGFVKQYDALKKDAAAAAAPKEEVSLKETPEEELSAEPVPSESDIAEAPAGEGEALPSPEDVQPLLDELSAFAAKNASYAGARAYALLGTIYGDLKQWAEAEAAYTAAARRAPKIYLAPVSLYNAAAAAEEQALPPALDRAVSLYAECAGYPEFPAAHRAQFAIGRIEETRGNDEAALESYRKLISAWPHETEWAKLAQNRIIALTIREAGN